MSIPPGKIGYFIGEQFHHVNRLEIKYDIRISVPVKYGGGEGEVLLRRQADKIVAASERSRITFQNASNGNSNSPFFRVHGDNDVNWVITVEPHRSSQDIDEKRFSQFIFRCAKNNQTKICNLKRMKFLVSNFQLSVTHKKNKRVIASIVAEILRGFVYQVTREIELGFPSQKLLFYTSFVNTVFFIMHDYVMKWQYIFLFELVSCNSNCNTVY